MIHWIISIILLVLCCIIVSFNMFAFFVQYVQKKQQGVSIVPFIGGILGCIGLFFLPIEAWRLWFWLPFVFDPGGAVYLIILCVSMIKEKK